MLTHAARQLPSWLISDVGKKMSRLTVILIGAASLAVAFVFWGRAKANYDAFKQLEEPRYDVVPIRNSVEALLAEIESKWTATDDSTDNSESEALVSLQLTPSVSAFLEVANSELPPYRWFSSESNRRSIRHAMIRNVILPRSNEKRWYVGMGEHIAFIRCNPNLAFVYRDEPNRLRVTRYVRRPNKAPEPTTTAVTSPATQEPRQP
jgi:hypothetical protein